MVLKNRRCYYGLQKGCTKKGHKEDHKKGEKDQEITKQL